MPFANISATRITGEIDMNAVGEPETRPSDGLPLVDILFEAVRLMILARRCVRHVQMGWKESVPAVQRSYASFDQTSLNLRISPKLTLRGSMP